ncbi:transcriptional regulator, TetR family [Cryptosporangium aurantiacum]|uniref:Transcriptional regulator, TetR family n=2 Tax=Cryptosporangium aurantiacum TaxID=134849 RepID=A0A1M7Q473_9ACTN|nr:transcriptional regulator, TetR family [Cryptosporangium aurantiacum]
MTTAEAIYEAGRRLFLRDGYATTTVRAIAAEAGINPALVIRHYGSKEALFLATMTPTNGFTPILEGPLESLGEALVEFVINTAGTPGSDTFQALIMAADRPDVRERILSASREFFEQGLAERLSGDDRELRARLVSAQVSGLMLSYWVLKDPVLTRSDRRRMVALAGRALQRLITP